jgi:DNA-binding NtrC family response regulator
MEVSGVFDATAALARLDERLFDVVVSDVRMPGLNGLELLARITAMDTPPLVILLTGHPSIDVALKGMRAGAFDYLIKPPEIDALVDRIRAAHHHRRSLMAQQRDARLDSIRAGRPD